MNRVPAKQSSLSVMKPLAASVAALLMAQANLALAKEKFKEKPWVQISELRGGKTRVLTNPTSIVINDTCADPAQAECAALLDVYGAADAPEVPVVKASPYVSIIDVPSYAFPKGAKITDVNVYINDLHHTSINDVDIALVAPDGRWVMLASNVGSVGATQEGAPLPVTVAGLNWKFDDSASLPLPRSTRDDGRLSGRETNPLYNVIYDEWIGVWTDQNERTYKPTDYDNSPDSDHFPDNAVPSTTAFNTSTNSAPLTTTTVLGTVTAEDPTTYRKLLNGPALSNLNGISPIGQWRLIVVDDFYWYAGEIKGGWSLEITAKR